jgi:hypothetical protein
MCDHCGCQGQEAAPSTGKVRQRHGDRPVAGLIGRLRAARPYAVRRYTARTYGLPAVLTASGPRLPRTGERAPRPC